MDKNNRKRTKNHIKVFTRTKTARKEFNKFGPVYRHDHPMRAYKLCLLGLKDKELAIAFGVNQWTIDYWKNKYPEFAEAIKTGKDEADSAVAHALYQRALGYSHKDVHITNYKGDITVTKITKHYPPDTAACVFWLKNRQKERWSDAQNMHHTGGILVMQDEVDLSDVSDEELYFLKSIGITKRTQQVK